MVDVNTIFQHCPVRVVLLLDQRRLHVVLHARRGLHGRMLWPVLAVYSDLHSSSGVTRSEVGDEVIFLGDAFSEQVLPRRFRITISLLSSWGYPGLRCSRLLRHFTRLCFSAIRLMANVDPLVK